MPAADALTSGTWLDILDAVVFSPFAAGGSTGLLLRNLFSALISSSLTATQSGVLRVKRLRTSA